MGRPTAYTGIRFADNPPADAAQQEVQDFVDRYAKALAADDTEGLVALWQSPALWLGDPDIHAISSNEEVRKFFGEAKRHAAGADARPEILNLHWPNERVAIVEVRWAADDVATCTLRRNEKGELKLRAAVVHGSGAAGTHRR